MTALVGIYCQDGVVVGADSAATSALASGQPTVEQPVMKIQIVDEKFIIAGTGAVGLGQRFTSIVRNLWDKKAFSGKTEIESAKLMSATTIQDFGQTFMKPGSFGALVAYPNKDGDNNHRCHLVEFAVNDFQPEFKDKNLWYVSMGSGQAIIDPFLSFMREIFWSDGPPTVQDAVFIVTWLLDHAIKVNPGGVNNPVKIATLENFNGAWKARCLSEEELLEHRENQEAAKQALRNFKEKISLNSEALDLPTPPVE